MTLRWLVATLHLLALPIGISAILARGRALRRAIVVGIVFLATAIARGYGL